LIQGIYNLKYLPPTLFKKPLIHHPEGILSTGSIRLDQVLGIGGIPQGEFIEIAGEISSGKTTLCLQIAAETQKAGEVCAWIDTDHSLDPMYATRCGIDPNFMYISEPKNMEMALYILQSLVNSGSIALIIVDSITSLISQEELSQSVCDGTWGKIDRLFSQTLNRIRKTIRKNKTTIIFTDQFTTGISNVYHNLAKNPSRLATKLLSSVRMKLEILHDIRFEDVIVGNRIQVCVIKNQYFPCFQRTVFDIIYNKGVYKPGEIFDIGIELNLIQFEEGTYWFHSQAIGNKRVDALSFLDRNKLIAMDIEQNIHRTLKADF